MRKLSTHSLSARPGYSVAGRQSCFPRVTFWDRHNCCYEASEGTLLYTGDFKLRKGLSSEAAIASHAETLVMETTYGMPRYQFPPVRETLAALLKFCVEALEDG